MGRNSYDFRRSAWPAPPCVQRTRDLLLKVLARGTALLIIVSSLLLFVGHHSALTWVMGGVTLIFAVLVYLTALLLQCDLYGLGAGTEKKGSVYVLPIKRRS
jgi:hypothetical protein